MILATKFKYNNGIKSVYAKTTEYMSVGTYVEFEGEEYLVYESTLNQVKGVNMFSELWLIKEKDLKVERKYSSSIQGSSVRGVVKKIVSKDGKAYVQIDFTQGLKKKGTAGQRENTNFVDIPYKTFYSRTNTGFFPTPEVGDIVDVVFNDIDENDMIVSWSVENEESERFNDINKRKYKNKYIDVVLDNENLSLSVKNKIDLSSKNIDVKSDGFTNNAKDYIAIGSQGYIGLESKDQTSIFADSIGIKSKKGNIEVLSGKDVLIKGITIHNN